MRCPFCQSEQLRVIDSRNCDAGRSIRRRRRCETCAKKFTTYERVEQTVKLVLVKKSGERKPWDKGKIVAGLERACYKRPVEQAELLRVADEVEDEIKVAFDREVPSSAVGELVIDKLRRLDQVAYVRFASVYRKFKTLEELVDEAKAVIDAKRYEDPGQGRLFIDPGPAPRAAGNGSPAGAAPAKKPRRQARRPDAASE
jgi:transcriptional repressor NrdR